MAVTTPGASAETSPGRSAETTSGDRYWAKARPDRIALVLLSLAFAVLLIRIAHGSWHSVADHALIELRTRDVGGRHTPLIGPYSRYGWNHPGPLLFYALALPYRLLGSEGTGLLAGGLLLNALALAAVVFVGWRRGGAPGLTLLLAVVAVLVRALGAGFLADPWNPYVVVLPVLAVALLSWSVACGDRWALPFAVAFASFAIQSHVGAAPGALAPLLVAGVVLVIDVRAGRARGIGRVLGVTALVGVALWIPPLIEQLRPGGGNLTALWRFWTENHKNVPGLVHGAKLVAPQLALPAPWMTGHEHLNQYTGILDPSWRLPIVLFALAGAGIVAARRRDRESLMLVALALTLAVAAWMAASRLVGDQLPYLIRWTWLVGAMSWLAIGWTLLRLLQATRPVWARRFAAAAGLLAVTLFATVTVGAADARYPVAVESRAVVAVHGPLLRALRASAEPVLIVASTGDFGASLISSGLLMDAIHAGIDARFEPSLRTRVGPHVVAPDQAGTVLLVAADEKIADYAHDPNYRRILLYDSLSRVDRKELNRVKHEITAGDALDAQHWIDTHPKQLAHARAINARGVRFAVFQTLSAQPG